MKAKPQVESVSTSIWHRNTAAGRWYGFGRYYAMFPQRFVHDAILNLTRAEETILDPFCGRGNGPFAATVLGRGALGIDVNPIAWLFAAAKLQPAGTPEQVMARLAEIAKARRPNDRRSRSRFEAMAWAPAVRALLKAARRELDWRDSTVDRTLMAFLTLHMQDKQGCGLSNVMSPTIAFSPTYAVKWWTKKGLLQPPDIDPVAMLEDKIYRRYERGIPAQASGTVLLGDSRQELPQRIRVDAALLVTSPPYCGVTDYWNDHWIRLWMLGFPFQKNWKRSARFNNNKEYQELITSVFQESKKHLKKGAAILIRSDQRRSTAEMCMAAMREVWPRKKLLIRSTTAPHAGISNNHGRGGRKAKEIDLLMPGSRAVAWWQSQGFTPSAA
ncbi:MAG: site-specific DNA-methyltransferase [Gemmatimonadales bacterium]|nr:site-specific DNA-methyltransferase [Chloroflexota bacterium]MYG50289.1 site-specific DNA-methyltransferase [Gemmatimonadales bacterium]MYK34464.1 site-specific DNA-methyltransferase [Chloroflexota bacterium]